MKDDQKSLFSYLIFFFSFCTSLILLFIILKLLSLRPGRIGDLSDVLPFFRDSFIPQTHKIINYILSIVIIPLATLLQYFHWQKLPLKYPSLAQKLLSFFSLLSMTLLPLAFIITLKISLHSLNQYSYIFKLDPVIYTNTHFITFLLGILFFVSLYFFYENFKKLLNRESLQKVKRVIPFLAVFLMIVTLFDRTFDEKNLFISYIHQYIHTIPLMAPIQDVNFGKVLLVNADSQYGLLIIYLPALLFKFFIPLTFRNYFYLMIILGIFYYLFAFILLSTRLKSRIWALIGLFLLFTYHFYPCFDRYTRPMVFPMRYILDLPFFLLLLKSEISQKRWFCFILPLYLAIAFFYSYEAGASLILSYSFYLFLKTMTDKNLVAYQSKLFRLFLLTVPIVGWLFAFGVIYSLYAKIQTGYFPDWPQALFYLRIFSKGFAAGESLPLIGFHLLTLSLYFIVIIKSLILVIRGKGQDSTFWNISLAVYGLLILSYFIKSPYILNLVILSIPAIILFLTLFQELFELAVQKKIFLSPLARGTIFIPYLISSCLISFSFSLFVFRLSVNSSHLYWGNQNHQVESGKFYDELMKSAQVITKYEKSKDQVVLLSYHDGFIKLKAKKVNALRITNAQLILANFQVSSLLTELKKLDPQYIYTEVDTLLVNRYYAYLRRNIFPSLYEYLDKNYHKIETAGILDVWEKNPILSYSFLSSTFQNPEVKIYQVIK